ncbi:hypothetical protein IFM89_012051 [Coptis chinensis]|uniref:SHSP domain-containing protein n=1 Tax=Coptis chinensis TaxID=261450 RepID=A0A835IWD6_9MAGN|nr:hypothetical protein IFM89_012051 [Coptis chinensis]
MSIIPSIFGGRRSNIFDPISLDIWDPFQDFLLSPFRSEFSNETTQFANTRIDWKETPEGHVFKADLPGLKKEEVKVEVEEGRVLQISGERSKEKEEKNDKWHRVERSSGQFLRRFSKKKNFLLTFLESAKKKGFDQVAEVHRGGLHDVITPRYHHPLFAKTKVSAGMD